MYNIALLDIPDLEPWCDGIWSFGDFGPAHEEIQKISGIKNNNLEMSEWNGMVKKFGVISKDGETIYLFGSSNCVQTWKWQSEEDMEKLSENRDPIDAPSCPYKIQPENQGKLIWLSGPSGAGKSTTGQLMSKEAGFVYYEADCTLSNLNPFVPTDIDNPTLAALIQKPLKVHITFKVKSRCVHLKISRQKSGCFLLEIFWIFLEVLYWIFFCYFSIFTR